MTRSVCESVTIIAFGSKLQCQAWFTINLLPICQCLFVPVDVIKTVDFRIAPTNMQAMYSMALPCVFLGKTSFV